MEYIKMGRGEGKTSELIKMALSNQLTIIARNKGHELYIRMLALYLYPKSDVADIRIINWSDIKRTDQLYGRQHLGFLFDDIDDYLEANYEDWKIYYRECVQRDPEFYKTPLPKKVEGYLYEKFREVARVIAVTYC